MRDEPGVGAGGDPDPLRDLVPPSIAVARAHTPGTDGAALLEVLHHRGCLAARQRGCAGVVQQNDLDPGAAKSFLAALDGVAQVVRLEPFVSVLVGARGGVRPEGSNPGDDLAGSEREPLPKR